MCGICGIFDRSGNAVSREAVHAMNSVMAHRGPDGNGILVERGIGLGHRRLSIIDLGGGAQPIGNEDGRIQVTFNGEIYNFLELRKELEGLGHQFSTRSDTEVIVHGYEQWGTECVTRFNGIFAFALWDSTKRVLFLARDHLGVKPLYYAIKGERLFFASEIKALLQCPEIPREVDHVSLSELFTFRYVPSPKTLFKGILKLPPGHFMIASARGTEIKRYWNWIPARRKRVSEPELIETYQELLQDAIRLQMRSDVPVGLFLSSGIDSASILAIMRQHTSGRVKAFTIGFEDGENTNEVDDASELAEMFGAEHSYLSVSSADYVDYYQRYMRDLEEPVGNETAAAFYFVSKITSEHVKVALSGQGADEPWAGYHRHVGAKLSGLYSNLPGVLKKSVVPGIAGLLPRNERLKRGAASLGEADPLKRLKKIYSYFNSDMKTRLFRGWLKAEVPEYEYGSNRALSDLYLDVDGQDPLTQILYLDTRANLPDDLLMVGDKTSMANSLEARVPFLDFRLVEFAESLPPQLRMRGFTGKYLHKRALEKWLPKKIVYRKKKGFENPIHQWLRTRMRSFVEDALLSRDAGVREFFEVGYIEEILRKHQQRSESYMRQIYLLLSFELWHREFMRGGRGSNHATGRSNPAEVATCTA
jgi:asparagine synthase (glutamine-hydrolyzing)